MIGTYPDLTELDIADRPRLDPLFRNLNDGVSELTFAGIYCFRVAHAYRVSRLQDETLIILGADKGKSFFISPFSMPRKDLLEQLFANHACMKLVTASQAPHLREAGYQVTEDPDNFDYLYCREPLATLAGRALQKKRNLVHHFERENDYRTATLTPDHIPDAMVVLEAWRAHARDLADYEPALDALVHAQEFQLHGRITYVAGKPAGYALGETVKGGTMFVVHYEKTVPGMKGLYQFINMDLVRELPATITLINREQDLGDPGLRQAKTTYRPCSFVHKFRAYRY